MRNDSPAAGAGGQNALCRVNCGSAADYTDSEGRLWLKDREAAADKTWGHTGGTAVLREKTLPVHNTSAPGVYRAERYGLDRYAFAVEKGVYTARLHFAETFECHFRAGNRAFGAEVNGREILSGFDPYAAAGGFAWPVVIEYAGCPAPEGKIRIRFTGEAIINGIEIYPSAPGTAESVRQTSEKMPPEKRFIGEKLEPASGAKIWKVLFIGNSATFFWAIPESVQAMIETENRRVRIEPQRSLAGGKCLEYHYNQTDAPERIRNGRFDFVVLQECSAKQLDKPGKFFEYARKFGRVIHESGARAILYAQPGHLKTTDKQRREIMARCAELCAKLEAVLVPACETLRLCRAECPELVCHNADAVHMGMHGGYAIACSFFHVLTGESPPGNAPPAILRQQAAIDPEIARFLQRQARAAVEHFLPHTRAAAGQAGG